MCYIRPNNDNFSEKRPLFCPSYFSLFLRTKILVPRLYNSPIFFNLNDFRCSRCDLTIN